MRVCWCCVAFRSNYYDPSDVWSPLMLQKPLLMDPVNPFSNVADPQVRAGIAEQIRFRSNPESFKVDKIGRSKADCEARNPGCSFSSVLYGT